MSDNKASDFQVFLRIVKLSSPYTKLMILTFGMAISLAVMKTASPYIINLLVDDFVDQALSSKIKNLALLYVGILFLQVFMQYGFIYTSRYIGQNVVNDLRKNLFSHLLGFRMRYFDTTRIGVNSTRVINDIETISTVFTQQGIMVMFADVLGVLAILVVMFMTSVKLTLICLLTMPLLVIATYVFKERVKKAFEIVRREVAELNAFLQEHISGMKIVQIFTAERLENRKFRRINHAYTDANINTIKYYAIFFPVVEILSSLTLAIIVWWGARDLVYQEVTIGVLVAFPMYINRLFRPIRFLADKFNTIQMAMIAARRVFNLLDKSDHSNISEEQNVDELKGKVEFKNVVFGYDPEHPVIKNVSYKLDPGKTLALVGATGSGKSSIINVLSKLYDYQEGEVLLDDVNINDLNKDQLRNCISIVLQDVFLFTGTILDNIRLRNEDISDDQIVNAAKYIGVHDFIMQFPDGYNYVLEERGSNLSVGQRQLIAFVRALVFNPDILILDEATSSIDVISESIIQEAIQKLTQNRTAIIIAHRLSTIKHVNHILVLDQGEIIEEGNLDDLLKDPNGHFKQLYEMQFLDTHSVNS